MFGSNRPTFGGASQPFGASSSPFGSQQQQTGSTFGMNNAQSGFGGFGATGTNTGQSNNLFGMSTNNNNTGSSSTTPFGKAVTSGVPANTANSGSLFGSGSGLSTNNLNPPSSSGTAITPFSAYQEKDATTGITNAFQSISCMPEYRNFSFEELRFQDYQAGRITASSSNVTGTVSPFGTQNSNTNTGFGMIGNNNASQPQSAGTGNNLFAQRTASAQNSPFGSLSSNNTNTSSFGNGGAFGSANNGFGANNNSSPFGMNKPAGTATGGTGLFGNNNQRTTSGGLFGQTNPSATTGGAFGANNNTFGANNSNTNSGGLFGQSNNQPTSGGLFGNQQSTTFGQNQQSTTGGLFGQNNNTNTGLFGQQNNQTGGGLFGNKPAGGGLFGQNNTTTFGQNTASNNTSGGGLFGQNNNATGGGLFGQSNVQQPSGGLFGQNNTQNQTGGIFGQSNTQQPGGGLFGQNNNNQQSGGLFGQNNNTFGQSQTNAQQPAGSTSLFGNKPATGGLFGQNNTSNTFGQNNANTGGGLFGQSTNQQSGGGLFGQNSQQQPSGGPFGQQNQQQSGGLFGQNNNQSQTSGLFGAKPAGTANTGLFGSSQPTQQSGGLFGQNNNTFGQQSQPQQQQSGSLFGQNNNQQQGGLFGAKPAGATGGLFGNNTANNTNQSTLGQASGGLFGAKPAANTGAAGGLFGGNNANTTTQTGGGLFGNNNTSNTPSLNSGGLFGAKPAGSTGATGGLFGNTSSSNQTGSTGGLFGSKTTGTTSTGLGGGLFGNTSTANNNTGGLFGNKPSQIGQQLGSQQSFQQQQQALQQQQTQSIGNNVYGTNELFSRVTVPNSITQPTKPSATKINADLKRKASLTGAYRLAPKPLFKTKALSAGFYNRGSTIASTSPLSSSSSSPDSIGKEIVPVKSDSPVFSSDADDAILTADKLLFNPDKKSFKNLIINKKQLEENANKSKNAEIKRITFNSKTESNEELTKKPETYKDSSIFSNINETPTATKEAKMKQANGSRLTTSPSEKGSEESEKVPKIDDRTRGVYGDDISFTDDGYYISPSFDTLASKTLPQLRKISGLVVGHESYGKIEFLEPVDLSNIPLPLLCGTIIVFEPKSCIVYPNSTNIPKEGEGINVRARISCYKCFPADKATREPIKDANHQLVRRHIAKLKKLPHTKFESYDPVTGCWTFVVDHPVSG